MKLLDKSLSPLSLCQAVNRQNTQLYLLIKVYLKPLVLLFILTSGDQPPFRLDQDVYMLVLLMISRGLLGCISCVNDLRSLLYTRFSLLWFILSSVQRLRPFVLIVLMSIFPLWWNLSYSLIALSFSSHAHIFINKMGVAQRKHRHILETARALLISSSIPHNFWAEVILTSVNLINITPYVLADKTPHECLSLFLPTITCSVRLGCFLWPAHQTICPIG